MPHSTSKELFAIQVCFTHPALQDKHMALRCTFIQGPDLLGELRELYHLACLAAKQAKVPQQDIEPGLKVLSQGDIN